jgi:Flp pilus assembly protein TadB
MITILLLLSFLILSLILFLAKHVKSTRLQDPSEISGDNTNNINIEATRNFWNKNREAIKDRINEFEMDSKNENIRDLYRRIN